MALSFEKILNLPEKALLEKRLTKVFFMRNFLLTAPEKKFLNEHIKQMTLLANLSPNKVNVPAFQDDKMIFEEIQMIVCSLHDNRIKGQSEKAVSLIQKYIPYPVLLFVEDGMDYLINACRKRISLNDQNKRTIENCFSTAPISKLYKNENISSLFNSLNFSSLDKTNLKTLYESYIGAIVEYQASLYTGNFKKRTPEFAEQASQYLSRIEQLEDEISNLSKQIKKESQINMQVQLNIQIQEKRDEIERLRNEL